MRVARHPRPLADERGRRKRWRRRPGWWTATARGGGGDLRASAVGLEAAAHVHVGAREVVVAHERVGHSVDIL
eukprot:6506348-Prymnesium_polylepis.1